MVSVVDSIVLAEPAGDPLGGYTGFFGLAPSGAVIVSDIGSRRVLRFDASGRFVGQVGREGEGPGEFRLPSDIVALPAQSAFGVIDANRSRLLIFSEATSAFQREVTIPFQRAGSSVAVDDNTMIFAPLLTDQALVRWSMDADQFTTLAPMALEVPGMHSIVLSAGVPGVARADSTLLLWYPVVGLLQYRLDGSAARHTSVPVRLRRGEGVERIPDQQMLQRAGSDSSLFSTTLGIGRIGTGEVVLGALDARRIRDEGGTFRETDIRVYLTVIDVRSQRACVDGVVPITTDASSVMVMHDGDVHLLARQVADDGAVRTVVYRYRVDTSACEWLPLGSG